MLLLIVSLCGCRKSAPANLHSQTAELAKKFIITLYNNQISSNSTHFVCRLTDDTILIYSNGIWNVPAANPWDAVPICRKYDAAKVNFSDP